MSRGLRWLVGLGLLAGLAWGGWLAWNQTLARRAPTDTALSYDVIRRTLVDTVIERGTLESQNTVSGRCELPGWENKIIFIAPEGATVKKEDVVVRFDSAEIDRGIAEKRTRLIEVEGKHEQARQELEVQKNKNESDVAAAELELTLADLDLKKYRDGDYIAEKADMERSIAEGDAELEKVNEELSNMRALVRKGFRSPEQLRELELRVQSAKYRLDRDQQKYRVLVDFDHQRKITEFEAKASEAKRKLERARTTASAEVKKFESQILAAASDVQMVKGELQELEDFKSKCEIRAPQDGTVAYANREWFDPEDRIREGATVRRQQDVFYLPDMSRMQVKVSIHESVVNKVKKGMAASIRVDANPDLALSGVVDFVSELSTSSFSNAKNYEVNVLVSAIPESLRIKPGMTAQVEVHIGSWTDLLAVPVGAISEHFQQSWCYVRQPDGEIRRTRVTIGRTTHSFVEITEGLTEGDVVLLDAYQRGMTDFGERERDAEASVAEQQPPAAAAPEAQPAPDQPAPAVPESGQTAPSPIEPEATAPATPAPAVDQAPQPSESLSDNRRGLVPFRAFIGANWDLPPFQHVAAFFCSGTARAVRPARQVALRSPSADHARKSLEPAPLWLSGSGAIAGDILPTTGARPADGKWPCPANPADAPPGA